MSAPVEASGGAAAAKCDEALPVVIDTSAIPLNGKSALLTGITGQDGSYLAELLLSKVRPSDPRLVTLSPR